jgi:hypothetical protein
MSRFTLPALLTAAALAVGCTGGYVASSGTAYATYSTPDLAYVSPGVYAVADYDYPVFYSNNYYWRYDNNRWYRSAYYDRGWTYARPPQVIARIESPYRYRHYRGTVVRRGTSRPGYYRNDGYRNDGYYRDGRYYDRDGRVIRDHRR